VTIELYTTLGQYVSTVYNGFLIRGDHKLSLNKGIITKGNYYLKLKTKTITKTVQLTFQ
jgi:hypothetical protein